MTYLNYDVFDKAIIVGPLYKKFEKHLAHVGSKWNANQIFRVKCYAQDARDYFKDILLQSLNTTQDYRVDPTCYPHITHVYPSFTQELGDPFLDICLIPDPTDEHELEMNEVGQYTLEDASGYRGGYSVVNFPMDSKSDVAPPIQGSNKGGLDSVEKLVCLILFSEHMIAYCDARWEEVDTSDVDYLALVNDVLEEERGAADRYDASVREIEPLFEDKLTLSSGTAKVIERGGIVVDVEDLLEMIGVE
ncbi:hypothetical protein MD484_g4317, partial [Candolleomyces efflorescens]